MGSGCLYRRRYWGRFRGGDDVSIEKEQAIECLPRFRGRYGGAWRNWRLSMPVIVPIGKGVLLARRVGIYCMDFD